jgi:16S rRNA (cytidine1402-2'-O)-methyltransferase
LLSEAGVPAIADPGASIVKLAHEKGIQVVPLVGPSSILMAMMASGMNGQNFAFNGYLPIDKADRKKAIKELERVSREKNQSQVFIETPYRNEKLFTDLKAVLTPTTQLCIAADITLSSEYIKTHEIRDWKHQKPDLHKRPAIFIIQK